MRHEGGTSAECWGCGMQRGRCVAARRAAPGLQGCSAGAGRARPLPGLAHLGGVANGGQEGVGLLKVAQHHLNKAAGGGGGQRRQGVVHTGHESEARVCPGKAPAPSRRHNDPDSGCKVAKLRTPRSDSAHSRSRKHHTTQLPTAPGCGRPQLAPDPPAGAQSPHGSAGHSWWRWPGTPLPSLQSARPRARGSRPPAARARSARPGGQWHRRQRLRQSGGACAMLRSGGALAMPGAGRVHALQNTASGCPRAVSAGITHRCRHRGRRGRRACPACCCAACPQS